MMLYGMQAVKTRKSVFLTPCFLHCPVIGGFCPVEKVEYMIVPDFCEI